MIQIGSKVITIESTSLVGNRIDVADTDTLLLILQEHGLATSRYFIRS
ncbi:MAG: hypothetical protein ABIM98_09125 [candidate division WOR-3 bacterium]